MSNNNPNPNTAEQVEQTMDMAETTDESKFSSADDFTPSRGGDGERLPVPHEIPGIDGGEPRRIKVLPMNYGDVKRYFGDGTVHDVDEKILARLFDRHVVHPKLAGISGHDRGRVTEDDVNELYPMDPRHLLEGVFNASGIDASIMMDGTEGQVEIEGN